MLTLLILFSASSLSALGDNKGREGEGDDRQQRRKKGKQLTIVGRQKANVHGQFGEEVGHVTPNLVTLLKNFRYLISHLGILRDKLFIQEEI